MKKIILTTIIVFCFGLIYGQYERLGWEQETVFNKILESQVWAKHTEISINGRVCRIFVRFGTSPKEYIKAIEEVFELLNKEDVSFFNISRDIPFEFYFTNNRKIRDPGYLPGFVPEYPDVERYDGIREHHVMVLTHMSDWSNVCKIITPLTPDERNKTVLQNRLIYAMGRILHEYNRDYQFYWDPGQVLNDPARKGVGGSIDNPQTGTRFWKELNRFAMHSSKAYVGEFFVYGIYNELKEVLPTNILNFRQAVSFYFNVGGPESNSIRDFKERYFNK